MRTLFLAITIFGLLFGAAIAENSDSIKRCNALKTDAVRRACFDHIAKGSSVPEVQSNWVVRFDTSKVDDTRTVILSTQALEISSGRYGNISRFTLMIACRENTTNLWIHFGGHFMSDYQHGRVTYRIDQNPAKRKRLRESNNNESLGLWNGGAAIPFIKALFGAGRLYVQATPHSESSVEAEFDISGLEDAIKPLRESCHW